MILNILKSVVKYFLHPYEQHTDYKLPDFMNYFTLGFKNQDLEDAFAQNEKSRIIVLFRISTLIQIFANFTFWVNNQFFLKNPLVANLRIAFCVWHIFIMFIEGTNRRINYKTLISIFQMTTCFLSVTLSWQYVEAQLYSKPCMRSSITQGINSGLNQGIFCISYILACPHWMVQCIILVSNNMFLVGILGNLGSVYWTFYVILILLCVFFRLLEKYRRLDFYQICQQTSNLHACKNIFDKTVPNSILILTNNDDECEPLKLIYSNDFAIKYLSVTDQSEILEKLKNIYIQSESELDNISTENLQSIYQKSKVSLEHENLVPSHRNSFIQNDYEISNESVQFLCFKLESQNRLTLSSGAQKKLHFEIRIVPCLWENKKSILLIMNDISEKVRLKHLKELDQYKDRLLATVSHDLKTPLNGMVLATNILQSIIKDKQEIQFNQIQEINNYLDQFSQYGNLLLFMINDLLDYSQINNGQLRLTSNVFSLSQTFDFVNAMLVRQAIEKNIVIQWDKSLANDTLYTDQNRLKQVLINLVANAIKFTKKGFIVITARDLDDIVEIEVKDTGCGISEDIQKNLFKLYSTYDPLNNNQHGIGLGLTISQQLVKLLGPKNRIDLESRVNIGTSFKFQIYRELSQSLENSIAEQKIWKKKPVPQFPGSMLGSPITDSMRSKHYKSKTYQQLNDTLPNEQLNVLIVDDTPFNIVALTAILNKAFRCKVYKAFNGIQALEIFQTTQLDLILMDVNMPEMDGYQCTEEIRKLEKHDHLKYYRSIIVIIVTAFTSAEDKQKSLKCGANDHLDKPVNLDELRQKLKKFNLYQI